MNTRLLFFYINAPETRRMENDVCKFATDTKVFDPRGQTPPGGGGGGTRLSCGRGVPAAEGRKPDPVANRSVHKKYTLLQYTLLKKFIMHTLSQYCTVAGAQIAGLSQTLWAGNPWEATL